MKKALLLFCLIIYSAWLLAQKNKNVFIIKNTLNIRRDSELIVLPRQLIENRIGKLQPKEYVKIYKTGQLPLIVQFDDMNHDGIWDEAVFIYSFSPKEIAVLNMQKTQTIINKSQLSLAHVRMRPRMANGKFGSSVKHADMPYQNIPAAFSKNKILLYLTEGPGWENDKVAFRLYFDTRNAKDIYGKRISGMVMDTVGANPKSSYHKLSNWGMDILNVEKSLGAGGLAFSYQENRKDTLVRLGGLNVQSESYDEISHGPIRAIFKMNYHWTINGRPIEITEYISIWGGQYFYQSKIFINGKDLPKDLKVDMGIADFYNNQSGHFSLGNSKVFYSFGRQSENKDNLGMAIISRANDFSRFWHIGKDETFLSDITQSYLSEEKVSQYHPITFRFYTCWCLANPYFNDENYFTNFLHNEAVKFSNPIIIL